MTESDPSLLDTIRNQDLVPAQRIHQLEKRQANGVDDFNVKGAALFDSALHNDYDAVSYFLDTDPELIDYTNEQHMSILAIAFARGREFFDFILQRQTHLYFLQYLLCRHYFSVNATAALDYFIVEFQYTYLDDFAYAWNEAQRLSLEEMLAPSLHYVVEYYRESKNIDISDIMTDNVKSIGVNTQLINAVFKWAERAEADSTQSERVKYANFYLKKCKRHQLEVDLLIELCDKDRTNGMEFIDLFYSLITFMLNMDFIAKFINKFNSLDDVRELIKLDKGIKLFDAVMAKADKVNYCISTSNDIVKRKEYMRLVSELLKLDLNGWFDRYLLKQALRQIDFQSKHPSVSSETETTLLANLFKGVMGDFKIMRDRDGFCFLTKDKDGKDTNKAIETKGDGTTVIGGWKIGPCFSDKTSINYTNIKGIGGAGYVSYEPKLGKALKVVERSNKSESRYETDITINVPDKCSLFDIAELFKQSGKEFDLLQLAILTSRNELVEAKNVLLPELTVKMDLGGINNVTVMKMKSYEQSLHHYLKNFNWAEQSHEVTCNQRRLITGDILKAMEFLFDVGISHNDIKPSNFLVDVNATDRDGYKGIKVVLTDFGLATSLVKMDKLSKKDKIDLKSSRRRMPRSIAQYATKDVSINAGTPGFAAPEQFGGLIDRTTDIYGLGRTMLFLLKPVMKALNLLYDPNQQEDFYETKTAEVIRRLTNVNQLLRPQNIVELRTEVMSTFQPGEFKPGPAEQNEAHDFVATASSFYANEKMDVSPEEIDPMDIIQPDSSELCVPYAVVNSFHEALRKMVPNVKFDFWRRIQVFIACVSPRTNDNKTDILERFPQRGYVWKVMQRMALPTGVSVPGWQIVYPGLDLDVTVKLKSISWDEAKNARQNIPPGTIVVASRGNNLKASTSAMILDVTNDSFIIRIFEQREPIIIPFDRVTFEDIYREYVRFILKTKFRGQRERLQDAVEHARKTIVNMASSEINPKFKDEHFYLYHDQQITANGDQFNFGQFFQILPKSAHYTCRCSQKPCPNAFPNGILNESFTRVIGQGGEGIVLEGMWCGEKAAFKFELLKNDRDKQTDLINESVEHFVTFYGYYR